MDDLRLTTRELENRLSQLKHSELAWVANIDWACKTGLRVHHSHHDINEIIDITKTAGLLAITINGDVFTL